MPAELEQHLARYAEALDGEAPPISVAAIVARPTVALDLALVEFPGPAWSATSTVDDAVDDVDVVIELAPVPPRRPPWRRASRKVAFGAAAVAMLVVAIATVDRGEDVDQADVPPPTIPNPVPIRSRSSDGEVSVSTPSTWDVYWPDDAGRGLTPDVWFGLLWRPVPNRDFDDYTIGLVDPVAYDAWCAENGGSPLLTSPADASAIAQQLIADPDFETTPPVPATVGGVEAISIDVALAPGGEPCGIGIINISRWIHSLGPRSRLRLYLLDLPDGMTAQTLAITVVAPEEHFDDFIAEAAPIVESIELNPAGT